MLCVAVQSAPVVALGNGQGGVELHRLAGPLGRLDALAQQAQQGRLEAALKNSVPSN